MKLAGWKSVKRRMTKAVVSDENFEISESEVNFVKEDSKVTPVEQPVVAPK